MELENVMKRRRETLCLIQQELAEMALSDLAATKDFKKRGGSRPVSRYNQEDTCLMCRKIELSCAQNRLIAAPQRPHITLSPSTYSPRKMCSPS